MVGSVIDVGSFVKAAHFDSSFANKKHDDFDSNGAVEGDFFYHLMKMGLTT